MRKGTVVKYRINGDRYVQAIVRTAHKDGSFTVEARYVLNATGKADVEGGYLGHVYRMPRFRLLAQDYAP